MKIFGKNIKTFLISLIFAMSCANTFSVDSHTTSLNYVFSYQIKPTKDFAQVTLEVKTKHQKLTKAFQRSDYLLERIQQLTQQYCQKYKLKEKSCNIDVEIADEQIETLYKVEENKIHFSSFQNQQVVKLRIENLKNIGHLVDDILKISDQISMTSFNRIPENEDQIYEQALKAGVDQGFRLCNQMKGFLKTIVSVEEVVDFQVSEDEQEEYQQASDEQDQENEEKQWQQRQNENGNEFIEWKFQVLCSLN